MGAVLAGGLAFAAPAGATNVTILDGQMNNPLTVNIAGIGNVLDAPITFHTIYGATPKTILAWCVDVLHHISLGDYNPDLSYTDTNVFDPSYPFTTNPSLTAAQVTQIDTLVNYGTAVYNDGSLTAVDKQFKVGAAQGAIWKLVSHNNVTLVTGNNADATYFNGLVTGLAGANYLNVATGYGTLSSAVTFITPTIYPAAAGTQSFLFASPTPTTTGGVPEPGTWVMMIGGFGAAGAMLRRRRRAAAVA